MLDGVGGMWGPVALESRGWVCWDGGYLLLYGGVCATHLAGYARFRLRLAGAKVDGGGQGYEWVRGCRDAVWMVQNTDDSIYLHTYIQYVWSI